MTKIALPVCLALIAAGAAAHGTTTLRWAEVSPTAGRYESVHTLEVKLADYVAEEVPNDVPVKEKSVATSRRYRSASRQQTVVVSVTTGAPGSVSTHTPDVCYPGSGYKTVKAAARETVDVPGWGPMTCYVAEFEKTTASHAERQRVRWAWATTGAFEAPDRPRFAYLRVADLAKLYIVTAIPSGESAQPADTPAAAEFLAAALGQYADRVAGR